MRVWPILLNVDVSRSKHIHDADISTHRDYEQIEVDIPRSMLRFLDDVNEMDQERKRQALRRIIHGVALKHPDVHYYQGFNDICSVFLLVAGEPAAFAMAERIALYHLGDACTQTLLPVMLILELLFPLVNLVDPEVHSFLISSSVMPDVAIEWLITWFSHSLDSLDKVARLFDVFLSSHPAMPLYLAAAAILQVRTGLLQCECEFSAVHHYLKRLPSHLNVERLIKTSLDIFRRYPPKEVQELSGIFLPPTSHFHDDPKVWTDGHPLPNPQDPIPKCLPSRSRRRSGDAAHRYRETANENDGPGRPPWYWNVTVWSVSIALVAVAALTHVAMTRRQ
mmetsp:Transcript_49815/g.82695  ORF Transcript_49815/g.82695 Transcript_49815/m.82695 type:complete len:337 (+) Transcript_49815:241-1251(+)